MFIDAVAENLFLINFALGTSAVLHLAVVLKTPSDEVHILTLFTCPYCVFYV